MISPTLSWSMRADYWRRDDDWKIIKTWKGGKEEAEEELWGWFMMTVVVDIGGVSFFSSSSSWLSWMRVDWGQSWCELGWIRPLIWPTTSSLPQPTQPNNHPINHLIIIPGRQHGQITHIVLTRTWGGGEWREVSQHLIIGFDRLNRLSPLNLDRKPPHGDRPSQHPIKWLDDNW